MHVRFSKPAKIPYDGYYSAGPTLPLSDQAWPTQLYMAERFSLVGAYMNSHDLDQMRIVLRCNHASIISLFAQAYIPYSALFTRKFSSNRSGPSSSLDSAAHLS
jgi:hypothetical protein